MEAPLIELTLDSWRGAFHLQVAGLFGKGYALEVSTNLLDWLPIQTNAPAPDPDVALPANIFEFIDLDAANYSLRFYRARQEP